MALVNFKVTPEEKAALKQKAKDEGVTMSALLRRSVGLDRGKTPRRPGRPRKVRETPNKDSWRQDGEASVDRMREGIQVSPLPPVTAQQVANTARIPVKTAERATKGKEVKIVNGQVLVNGEPL